MALVLADRVRESTLTTGTGTVTLVGPVTGYQTFAVIGNGNTTYYTISNPNGTEWEVGIGTYTAASKTLSRDTVLSSSNGGAKTSFSVGSKDVFVSYPAEKSINQDEVGNTFVPNLGATTPSSGVFTTLTGNSTSQFGRSSANYFQAVGAAANLSPEISVQGSDASIPFTIESKGTGAVNLVPGSRGVNVSNGQTVTAITRTAAGGSYTSAPIVAISAPTTAGGVQATASAFLSALNVPTITSGGTGYSVNDVLTFVGGSGTAYQVLVTAVSGGVITAVSAQATSLYTTPPSNPISVTGGTGTGATFTVPSWAVTATFTITNAGSGYVEQPTVTFSGGGGSGAAAYAVVGSGPKITSIGSSLAFALPSGDALRITNSGASNVNFANIQGNATTGSVLYGAAGADANISVTVSSFGTGSVRLSTNNTAQEQLRVSHTASAVNYVQVTGNATTSRPLISAQGSDSNVGLNLASKGNRSIALLTNSVTAFETLSPASGVNYFTANGSVTSFTPSLAATGTDTNIAATFQSKGTGAINLVPGSSGVNVSNGNTVTAITRTAAGSGYTSSPTVAITAPTTAGGVQATATCTLSLQATPTIVSGGTGYTAGDTLTLSGGTSTTASQLTVTTVSGGVITGVSILVNGVYTAVPANNISVTGGTGSGATFSTTAWGVTAAFTITNAGSGYVEQPTVSFSGGGGSGAAAYASVGTGTTVRSIGSPLSVFTPGGEAFRISDAGVASTAYWNAFGGTVTPIFRAIGSTSGILETGSAVPIQFRTNGTTSGVEQLRVSHTASAVNYVQVTGNSTGNGPIISAQGSDTNVDLLFSTKGTAGSHVFRTNSTVRQFQINHVTSAVNYGVITGSIAGAAVPFSVAGSDTNIDLALTPKGTGRVRFGTHTATADTAISGYIEILDSGGTVRRLAVIT